MKLCPKCGTQYPDDANFCPGDAARLIDDESSNATSEVVEVQSTAGARVLGGRFELGERIGGAQTGQIYRALDRKQKRPCAVKLVDASVFPRNLLLQRTERELGKLARLDADGIARIYGHGKEGETLWIASELVAECQTLHDIVFDEGPMQVERAAGVICKVGKALAEAARMGVIHRDLAPKNILVVPGGGIKIINFGVAVPTTEKVQGVAEFVAPEIVEGKPVDQRANIYSLGALFFYLITGRPPYMGEPEEVHAQHLNGTPELPSTHGEGISEAVDGLILRALERSSSKRFMTLRQLLSDVERIAEGEEPVSAASSLARMSRSKKNPKLAQTMIGGFRVVNGTPVAEMGKLPQGEGAGERAGATASAGGTQVMGSMAVAAASPEGALPEAPGRAAAQESGSVVVAGDEDGAGQEAGSDAAASAPAEAGGKGGDGAADAPRAEGAAADTAAVQEHAPRAEVAQQAEGKDDERADAGGEGAELRETAWFKEGASAPVAAASTPAAARETAGKPSLPREERYQDDGQDKAGGLGPAAGAAQAMREVRTPEATADQVSDRELIQEMKSGRAKIMAAIVIGILLIGSIIAFAFSGKEEPAGGGADPREESGQTPAR